MIDASTSRVREQLSPGRSATLEAKVLRRLDSERPRAGTKPLLFLEGSEGHRFVLKLAEPALMAAEQTACELRELGGRPTIFARVATVQIEGLGEIRGLLKPYVELETEAELDSDTTRWSELQRTVILLEHAWEWLLDNLDTSTSQYALLGPDAYPVNIDWDRCYASDAKSELSRFAKYKSGLPNARTFLYSDYVEGRTELPFALLLREARRVSSLPEAEVRRVVERFAKVRFDDREQALELVERVLERRRRIEPEISRFVHELTLERARLSAVPPRTLLDLVQNGATLLWNQWQLALAALVRSPAGSLGRAILKLARRQRANPALRSDG
jgi:hypothetical protein